MEFNKTTTTSTETAALAAIAIASAGQFKVGETPYVVLPQGYKVEDLEKLLPHPTRPRGKIELSTADSFIAYVNKYVGGATNLYISLVGDDRPRFTAVFNDHAELPGWRDFSAEYLPTFSREWNSWIERHGKQMAQADFARFIEDNLPDIVAPSGADMLAVAHTLEAKKDVTFRSATRLSDGAQEFTYNEEIQGTAGKGTIAVPQTFDIGIPVFEGGPAYRITARLRYRIIDGGRLVLWYDLLRSHKVFEDAIDELRTQIEKGTSLKPFK